MKRGKERREREMRKRELREQWKHYLNVGSFLPWLRDWERGNLAAAVPH